MLAGIPQRTKTTFWCSRDFRNENKVLFGVCGSPATRKKCFLGFAGFPQQGKTAFWCLRDSRNEGKLLFGACGSPASISKNVLTIADFRRHTADFILTSNSHYGRDKRCFAFRKPPSTLVDKAFTPPPLRRNQSLLLLPII